jgi:hypothetical protein
MRIRIRIRNDIFGFFLGLNEALDRGQDFFLNEFTRFSRGFALIVVNSV